MVRLEGLEEGAASDEAVVVSEEGVSVEEEEGGVVRVGSSSPEMT